jgi:hypothetical protein
MKRTMLFLVLLVFLPIGCFPQQGDQNRCDLYKPRTLQSIIDAHQEAVKELESDPSGYRNRILLSSDSFQSTVTLVFLGKSRPLQGKRAELLEYWKKMLKRSDDLVSIFGTEMLFREGKKEYWIAVQRPLLDPLPKEVAVGKPFTAYIIWMGAIQDGNCWEWLFAMNEFDPPTESSTP